MNKANLNDKDIMTDFIYEMFSQVIDLSANGKNHLVGTYNYQDFLFEVLWVDNTNVLYVKGVDLNERKVSDSELEIVIDYLTDCDERIKTKVDRGGEWLKINYYYGDD